ncbi:MAG: hypothetical protein AAF721_09990 [Myxococcota bacterium]
MNVGAIAVGLVLMAPASVERADAAWDDERWADAAAAYAEAYAETGDIAYLFARGQAERLAGDCHAAIATYEVFIATEPLPAAVAAAEEGIAACRELVPEPEPAPEPEPEPEPVALDPVAPAHDDSVVGPVDSTPSSRPWYRDPLGATFVAVGGAGLVAGTVLAVVARRSEASAQGQSDLVEFAERNDRAVALSRASIPVFAVAGAFVIGGVIRWAVVASKRPAQTAKIRLSPSLGVRF